MTAEARLVGDAVEPLLTEGGAVETLQPLARHWGELLAARVTVIRADGVVLGDSYEDPATMENHLGRPESSRLWPMGWGSASGTAARCATT